GPLGAFAVGTVCLGLLLGIIDGAGFLVGAGGIGCSISAGFVRGRTCPLGGGFSVGQCLVLSGCPLIARLVSLLSGLVLLRCSLGGRHLRRLQVGAGFGLGDPCGGHRLLGRCHVPLGSVGLHPVVGSWGEAGPALVLADCAGALGGGPAGPRFFGGVRLALLLQLRDAVRLLPEGECHADDGFTLRIRYRHRQYGVRYGSRFGRGGRLGGVISALFRLFGNAAITLINHFIS